MDLECPAPLNSLLTAYASSLFQPLDEGQRNIFSGASASALIWEPAEFEGALCAIFDPKDPADGFEIIQYDLDTGDLRAWRRYFDGSETRVI